MTPDMIKAAVKGLEVLLSLPQISNRQEKKLCPKSPPGSWAVTGGTWMRCGKKPNKLVKSVLTFLTLRSVSQVK